MEKQYKRKTYYIKNSAQSKFISRFVITSLIGGVLAVSAFNFLAYKKIDSVLYSMRMPKVSPGGLLWNEMIYTNIFVAVFIMIVFTITARGLYNKVHGPLIKLTNDIIRMKDGDLKSDISLRQNDEFRDFAAELDGLSKTLNSRFTEISSCADKIAAESDKLSSDNNEKSLTEIKNSLQQLEQTIGSFKV